MKRSASRAAVLPDRSTATAVVLACFPLAFAVLVLLPLGAYFLDFLRNPLEPLARIASSREEAARLAAILGRTVGVAAGGATLSLAFGIVVFAAFQPLRRPARNGLWALAAAPLLIPAHFSAIAWVQTAGNAGWLTAALQRSGMPHDWAPALLYSSPGCALVLALHFYPIAWIMVWLGARAIGSAAIESAATLMPPGRLWMRLLTGWLRSWLAAAWLVVFLLCLLDYSAASVLRRHVFTVEIMTAYGVYYDPPRVMGLTLPLVAVSLAAAALLGRLLARFDWPAYARQGVEWPALTAGPRRVFLAAGLAVALLGGGVPVGNFLARTGGWESCRAIVENSFSQAVASVSWSALAAAATVFLAFGLAMTGAAAAFRGEMEGAEPPPRSCTARLARLTRPARLTHLVRLTRPVRLYPPAIFCLMLALFALPGSVLALAQIAFWNAPGLGGLKQAFYDSGWMLPLGMLTLFLPIAYIFLWARLRQESRVLIDLERMNGNRTLRRRFLLSAPRLLRPASLAAVVVFVLAMQELHAAMLLAAPGQETLSIRASTLLHYAPDRLVAAFCLVSLAALALGAAAILGIAALLRRGLKRGVPHCAFD